MVILVGFRADVVVVFFLFFIGFFFLDVGRAASMSGSSGSSSSAAVRFGFLVVDEGFLGFGIERSSSATEQFRRRARSRWSPT